MQGVHVGVGEKCLGKWKDVSFWRTVYKRGCTLAGGGGCVGVSE